MEPRDLKRAPSWCGGSHRENGVSYGSKGKEYDTTFGPKLSKNSVFRKKNRKYFQKTSGKEG